ATRPTVKIPWQQRPAPAPRPGAPLLVAAFVNTLWAALICLAAVTLLVVLGRVSLGQRPTGVEALVAVGGWLLSHGVPIKSGPIEISLAPLSVTILALWRLNRAGVHTSRGIGARDSGSLKAALSVAGTVGLVYGLLGLGAALILARPAITVVWWRAALQLAVIGAFAALLGSIRTTGALRAVARRTPTLVRDALRAGVVAPLFLLGAGAAVTGVSVAVHGQEAARILHATPNGPAGQAGITVVCLAFAPNFVAWAAAYLLGPGFILRAGSLVSPALVTAGQVPPERRAPLDQLPAMAGLPDGPMQGPLWLLLGLPALAGLGAGLLLVRRRLRPRRSRSGDTLVPVPHWGRMLMSAGLAGPIGGLLMAAASFAASGQLDDGEPALGPVVWRASLFAMLALGAGALLGVSGAYIFRRRRE
ncbi:MAG TPA: DUF6350 family protein, partial [Candidatus Limnocylindrales bacterium]|nr:DUF6350 family protein [Candidatus Limnocylindrales bacterium]